MDKMPRCTECDGSNGGHYARCTKYMGGYPSGVYRHQMGDKWAGSPDTFVEAEFDDGIKEEGRAEEFDWTDVSAGKVIIGYRVMSKPTSGPVATPAAPAILTKAAKHMNDRAATYDMPEGERSMTKTVAAFNIITGRNVTESEGWLLMQILKDVRDRQRKEPHVDSLEDCVAYAALKAEARMGGR